MAWIILQMGTVAYVDAVSGLVAGSSGGGSGGGGMTAVRVEADGGAGTHDEDVKGGDGQHQGRIEVEGGTFWMGTSRPFFPQDGEGPATQVSVGAFALDRMEVSNAEFAVFVADTHHETAAETFRWSFVHRDAVSKDTLAKAALQTAQVPWWIPIEGADWKHPEGPDSDVFASGRQHHPVVHVSHTDALRYCQWKGGRLPTEAEFEYATRAGKANRTYAWGNKWRPRGAYRANVWQGEFPDNNTAADGYWGTSPVAAFGPQNRWGFFNIVGNVWEWVLDPWSVDRSAAVPTAQTDAAVQAALQQASQDSQGQGYSTDERVKKGGSFMCHQSYCYRYRAAARSHNTADSTAANLGFRCAYSPAHQAS